MQAPSRRIVSPRRSPSEPSGTAGLAAAVPPSSRRPTKPAATHSGASKAGASKAGASKAGASKPAATSSGATKPARPAAPAASATGGEELVFLPRREPLLRGILLQRYKRFLADVRLDSGELVTAHCVNTGAMEGLMQPGRRVWLRAAPEGTKRKLLYTWELVELPSGLVGVDTSAPNRVVRELLSRDLLPWLRPRRGSWSEVRAEVPYGERSRVDFRLATADEVMLLEVKNCHLAYEDGFAYFPDSVSERAAHHVEELAASLRPGVRAHVLFYVQMPGVRGLRPSELHDPAFTKAARRAARAGLELSAVAIAQELDGIRVKGQLPVDLAPYDLTPLASWRATLREADGRAP